MSRYQNIMFDLNIHDPQDVVIIVVWSLGIPSLLVIISRPLRRAWKRYWSKRAAELASYTAGGAIPDAATCQKCGYRLRGLDQFRCPECGELFDPNDPWTMFPRRRLVVMTRWMGRAVVAVVRFAPLQWILLAMIATSLILVMPLRDMHFWRDLHVAFPSFITGWILWIVILRQIWVGLRFLRPAGVRWAARSLSMLFIVIPASFSYGTGLCSEGELLLIGPEMLTIATVGHSCGGRHAMYTWWDSAVGRVEFNGAYGTPETETQLLVVIAYVAAMYTFVRRGLASIQKAS
jgi:hypothetical protein